MLTYSLKCQWYVYIRRDTSSSLPPKPSTQQKTLLLDLDETLVHSTVKRPLKFHYRLSVTLAKNPTEFYVIKRPNVDKFLKQVRLKVASQKLVNAKGVLLSLNSGNSHTPPTFRFANGTRYTFSRQAFATMPNHC